MASFNAELSIEGKTFSVLTASYGLYQATDESGKPSSGVRTHLIQLQLAGSDDETLTNWAADAQKRLDGKITFFRIDEQSKFKELAFEQAYCVHYAERVAPTNTADQMLPGSYLIEIGISPAVLKIGGTKHDNQWR
ncbi:type VI secretion system tube protein TssD [Spirosoma flavum]|uniref:Type VI secretion system tube protein TssD n=1 Tax=Spirosoma flavum TaxID=2048557 RepID=A0ABW6AFF9_9BACT